jgi:hypothetical protein
MIAHFQKLNNHIPSEFWNTSLQTHRKSLFYMFATAMGVKEKYLDERFDTSSKQLNSLPFFHSCEAIHLQGILDNNAIQPQHCDVYNENLLYLFYGKPAYKPSELANSNLKFLMPVCFIIKYDAIKAIKRAVAFDSGAYHLYTDHLHPSMKPEEFHLTPIKDTVKKVVHYFFNNNERYFEGRARKDLDYDPLHFQIESYHSIITSDHKTGVDDRKAAIEVQLDYEIPLNSNIIEAIILPKSLALSPIIQGKCLDTLQGIQLLSIPNYGVAAKNYYVYVLEMTKDFLIGKNLMNGY